MNGAELRPAGEVLVRLGIQVVIIALSGVAARGAWRNYRLSSSPFPKYVSYSLICLLVKTVFMASVTVGSWIAGAAPPAAFVPMIDHLGKVGWTLLFVNSFVLCTPVSRFMNRYFLAGNIILLVLISTIIWLYWLEFLYAAPPGRGTFSYFWGNLFYETWIVLVLATGFLLAWKADIAPKPVFLLAFAVLIAGEVVHMSDLLVGPNRLHWHSIVERLLLVSYCIISARLFTPRGAVKVVRPGFGPEASFSFSPPREEGK